MQALVGSLPWDLECMRRADRYRLRRGLELGEHGLITTEEGMEMPRGEAERLIDTRALDKWQERWALTEKGSITRRFVRDVRDNGWRNWQFTTQEGYILTGHGGLNGHLFMRGLVDDPSCPCGDDWEDSVHFLCDCGLYERFRNLQAMGVRYIQGNGWDLGGVIAARGTRKVFTDFVSRAFKFRARVVAQAMAERR